MTFTSTGKAFSEGTFRVLTNQLAQARAANDVVNTRRLEALLAGATSVAPVYTRGDDGRMYLQLGQARPARDLVQVGDIARVSYSIGDVVANDVRVVRVDGDRVMGVVGAVVRRDGRVEAWWNNAARMFASGHVPAAYPRQNVKAVIRNGVFVA